MFTLLKLVVELAFALSIFVGGLFFAEKKPLIAARITAMVKALFKKQA